MVDQLTQAAKAYELDHEAYPPGDGSGSVELAKLLANPGYPYFEFDFEMLDEEGHIRYGDLVVHYRCPGVHNPSSFDLWMEDADGTRPGFNNWE